MDNFKIEIVTIIIHFGRNNIIRNGQMQKKKKKKKKKNEASVSEVLALFIKLKL